MMTADLKKFRQGLRDIRQVTKRDAPEIANRACRNVAMRAAQFTPKTTPSKIRRELRRGKLLIRIAAAQLKREKGKYTRQEHSDRMRQIEKKRTSNTTALRAGWAKAILDMGGSFRGSKLRLTGSAAQGFGKKATINRLVAHIRNSIVTSNFKGVQTGAANIPELVRALDMAISFVTVDNQIYAERKINATLRRHSDK